MGCPDQHLARPTLSKSQRTKGAGGERELCALLSDEFGTDCRRKLGQARDSGNDIDLGPFRIECKRRARISVYEWMQQAVESLVGASDVPVVAMRADGKEWLVLMRFSDWAKVAREQL